MKIHEQGCLANTACLVMHYDGGCPGPYGKCTCEGSEIFNIKLHESNTTTNAPTISTRPKDEEMSDL